MIPSQSVAVAVGVVVIVSSFVVFSFISALAVFLVVSWSGQDVSICSRSSSYRPRLCSSHHLQNLLSKDGFFVVP